MANRSLRLELQKIFKTLNETFIERYICILHFALESTSKFSLLVCWKMVLLVVHDFQNGNWYRMLRNVSMNFLLFYIIT